ncbi:MAG: hypothetical protein OEV06_08240, partial [Anaerolineae bacterium]|nr:hypothetical protein [Anaerolineae bacterium]
MTPPANTRSTVCLHHNDADGRACGAIVRRAFNGDVGLFEMDYGDPIPWEAVQGSEKVIVADFSLSAEDMLRLAQDRQLIWIDHHKTSLNELHDIAQNWPGQRDVGEAACVLTWRYFFPDLPVPRAVVLIGDRDIWRWAEPETGAFGEGLFNQDTDPANDQLWRPLLDDETKAVEELVSKGGMLRDARLKSIERKIASYGHPVLFEGHRTLVVNDRGSGEMGAHIQEAGYEIGYCYLDNIQDGQLVTFVTLYSKHVDVSEIAKRFGGGGHPGAAGFSFPRRETPFPL